MKPGLSLHGIQGQQKSLSVLVFSIPSLFALSQCGCTEQDSSVSGVQHPGLSSECCQGCGGSVLPSPDTLPGVCLVPAIPSAH